MHEDTCLGRVLRVACYGPFGVHPEVQGAVVGQQSLQAQDMQHFKSKQRPHCMKRKDEQQMGMVE